MEGQLADEELSGLLVSPVLTESNGSLSVSEELLDSSGSGSRLSGSLGGQLLPRGLASGGISCGLPPQASLIPANAPTMWAGNLNRLTGN